MNLTRNASKGWLEAYRIAAPDGPINLLMLNDAETATVTLQSPDAALTVIDVMGVERQLPVAGGRISGWRTVVDETGGKGGKVPFRVESDRGEKSHGERSLKMSGSVQTRWYGFNDGNWARGTFDWTPKRRISRQYPSFPRGTEKITLEFYLGLATGTVWIDNVKVDVELYRKSNAASEYIN